MSTTILLDGRPFAGSFRLEADGVFALAGDGCLGNVRLELTSAAPEADEDICTIHSGKVDGDALRELGLIP